MAIVKISSKGHIILPKKARESLSVKAGDYVELLIEGNVVKVVPLKGKAEELAGVFRGLVKGVLDFKAIQQRVAEEVARDVAQGL